MCSLARIRQHDVQLDYYGKQLASAGSDRRIKIFDVIEGGGRQQTAELTGHEGPVWQVAWAHPEFGNVLASCSYDRQVFVWKEHSPQMWGLVHKYLGHEGSVNAVAFAPHEAGLRLACASSDENVSVLTHHGEGRWSAAMFKAHKTGVNSVAWAPCVAVPSGAADGSTSFAPLRLATGGCDNLVKLWTMGYAPDGSEAWSEACVLPALHTDWVRDVSWAPSLGGGGGGGGLMLASCAQDKRVAVWTEDGATGGSGGGSGSGSGGWSAKVLELGCVVWSVSWSASGAILAVAGGDNVVTLWKENALGEWKQIGQLSEDAPPEAAHAS